MFSDLSSSQLHTLLLLPRQQRGVHQPEASPFSHMAARAFHGLETSVLTRIQIPNPKSSRGCCLVMERWASHHLMIHLFVSEIAESPLKKSEPL